MIAERDMANRKFGCAALWQFVNVSLRHLSLTRRGLHNQPQEQGEWQAGGGAGGYLVKATALQLKFLDIFPGIFPILLRLTF